jgi:hypothetical protein
MNRNLLAAVAAMVLVIAVVMLGFHALGGPQTQRLIQSDLRTVRAIADLARQIHSKWAASKEMLPADLQDFPKPQRQNPVTHEDFSYRRKSDSQYELCSAFATDSHTLQAPDTNAASTFWSHPKGSYCFQFDVTQEIPPAPYYY